MRIDFFTRIYLRNYLNPVIRKGQYKPQGLVTHESTFPYSYWDQWRDTVQELLNCRLEML